MNEQAAGSLATLKIFQKWVKISSSKTIQLLVRK